ETGADVTVAARSVPRAEASSFGVLSVDRQGRVVEFVARPKQPPVMPGDAERALVSMGNYLFRRQALVDALLVDARRSTDHDFGRSIIPELVPGGRVYGHDFQGNEVPGVKPYEEQGYWRDVGSLPSYWEAHMDLLGESPRFDLDNRYWPVRTGSHPGPPARFIGSDVDNAHVGEASLVKRATIRNSILGRSVWVNEGAVIEDSIVMDHTTGALADRRVVHDDRVLDDGALVHPHAPAEDRVADRGALDERRLADLGVVDVPADEPRGRAGMVLAPDRPGAVVEIEARRLAEEVH